MMTGDIDVTADDDLELGGDETESGDGVETESGGEGENALSEIVEVPDDPSLFASDMEEPEEVDTRPETYPPYIAARDLSDFMTGRENELKVLPNFNSVIQLFRAQEANIRDEITRNLTRGGRLDCS